MSARYSRRARSPPRSRRGSRRRSRQGAGDPGLALHPLSPSSSFYHSRPRPILPAGATLVKSKASAAGAEALAEAGQLDRIIVLTVKLLVAELGLLGRLVPRGILRRVLAPLL